MTVGTDAVITIAAILQAGALAPPALAAAFTGRAVHIGALAYAIARHIKATLVMAGLTCECAITDFAAYRTAAAAFPAFSVVAIGTGPGKNFRQFRLRRRR